MIPHGTAAPRTGLHSRPLMAITLRRPGGAWAVLDAAEKLAVRAMLPGARGYDLAAHGARVARARGVGFRELLPLAMPTSWMVNNKAPSPVFRWWLTERADAWRELCELLDRGALAWPEATADERARVEALARSLAVRSHAACALSKVLAVLCPHAVPLMDDAAVAFATGAVPAPATADEPSAGVEHFVPMLDWFAEAVRANEAALVELAREHEAAPLDAPQALDRLLWMESWGWRNLGAPDTAGPRFWWLAEGGREGVVLMEPPHPGFATGERVDLTAQGDDAWRQRAREALARAV